MILLEEPYVSDFFIDTIQKNSFNVLQNDFASRYIPTNQLIPSDSAVRCYSNEKELFYTNSENAIGWITEKLSGTKLATMVELCKNKAAFRRKLRILYPDYFFEECTFQQLRTIDTAALKFPLILKPSVGFLSFVVYPVRNVDEWHATLNTLALEIEKIRGVFPANVVDINNFIVEELIDGEEFAIDAYFDGNGKSTILNIFKHPFFDEKDVSDRAYFTSKEIIKTYLESFQTLLDKIGKTLDFQNFPFHLELRVNGNRIIPIEMNPLRFCGWCITDIAQHAWGINVYEYYFNQLKLDWKNILRNADDELYYFTMAEVPSDVDKNAITHIDFEAYLQHIQNPLEIRRIDHTTKPVFAIVFAKTPSVDEIKNILRLDMHRFIFLV